MHLKLKAEFLISLKKKKSSTIFALSRAHTHILFTYNILSYCVVGADWNGKMQLSSISILRDCIFFLFFKKIFFFLVLVKSSVMSDSLLSPLLNEQPLEKEERKKREEKRPVCYFLS